MQLTDFFVLRSQCTLEYCWSVNTDWIVAPVRKARAAGTCKIMNIKLVVLQNLDFASSHRCYLLRQWSWRQQRLSSFLFHKHTFRLPSRIHRQTLLNTLICKLWRALQTLSIILMFATFCTAFVIDVEIKLQLDRIVHDSRLDHADDFPRHQSTKGKLTHFQL